MRLNFIYNYTSVLNVYTAYPKILHFVSETLSQPTITFNTTSVKELNVKLLRENTDLRCSLKFKRKYPTLYWEYNGLKIPGQFQIRKDDIDDGKDSIELSWNPLVGNGTNDNVTELTCVADYPFINKLMKSSLKLVQLESKNYGIIIIFKQPVTIFPQKNLGSSREY